MKKLTAIIFLVLLYLFPSQNSVYAATACCKLGTIPYACDPSKYGGTPINPGGYTYCIPTGVNVTAPCDRPGKEVINITCSDMQTCDNAHGDPKCVTKSKDPSCHMKDKSLLVFGWNPILKCCKPLMAGNDTCNDSKDFTIDCGGDPTYYYDTAEKTCIKIYEDPWNLAVKKTKCNSFVNDVQIMGIQTAIGCIPTDDLTAFLSFILKWVFGLAGGIVLLMVISTGYTLLTSSGNPEKLQGVKENLVSIFSGLILIGFSLVLLQTIGADILKLPTF